MHERANDCRPRPVCVVQSAVLLPRVREGSIAHINPLAFTHGLQDNAHDFWINGTCQGLQSVYRGMPCLQGIKVIVLNGSAVQEIQILIHLTVTETWLKTGFGYVPLLDCRGGYCPVLFVDRT